MTSPEYPAGSVITRRTGRVFINRETRTSDEYVFTFSDPDEVINNPGPNRPPATRAVEQKLPALIAAAQGVGRLFCLWANKPTKFSDYRVSIGTAFFVAPNVLCSARHVISPPMHPKLDLIVAIFCDRWDMQEEKFEELITKANFPLNGSEPPKTFWDDIRRHGLHGTSVLEKSPLVNVSGVPAKDEAPFPDGHSKEWDYHDYVFLRSNTLISKTWFIPTATIPETVDDHIVVIGYCGVPSQYDLNTSYGLAAAPTADLLYKVFHSFERRFLSPGNPAPQLRSPALMAHFANAEISTSGGPVLAVKSELTNPFPFVGVHVGAWETEERNYLLHTHHQAFLVDYAGRVLPEVEKAHLSANPPPFKDPAKRKQFAEFLKLVERAFGPNPSNSTELERVRDFIETFSTHA